MKTGLWLAIAAAAFISGGTALAQTPPAAAPTPAAQRPVYEVTKITDNVYQFRYAAHNSMFVVTPAGVIVTDPISLRRPAAQAYLAEIRKITQAPIKYMIYSHSHFDHVAGGQPFKDAGAIVIAQENAKTRLMQVSRPDIVMPDETVKDQRTITLGGETLQLLYLGRNHSDNMLVMLLPKEKILYTVDWIPLDGPPVQGFDGDTYLPEWKAGLKKVLALDWDRMIAGHGNRLGTKKDVQIMIDWLDAAETAAKPLAESNRCTADGRAATPMPAEFNGWANAAAWSQALDRYCTLFNQGY